MKTIRHFWPAFSPWLDELPDSRFQPSVKYHARSMMWWGLLLFVLKLGSRRQLDFDLREDGSAVLANLNLLADTDLDRLPVHNTLDHYIGHVGPDPMAGPRTLMVRRLIRMKALDRCRMPTKHFPVAIDATGQLTFHTRHCDRCLVRESGSKTLYMHQVLEAKIVGPEGLAISVATEFIENPEDFQSDAKSKKKRKQDCELKALIRLAPVLKRDYPQTPLCLTGDALYACGEAMQIARDNSWAFFYVFKRGSLPEMWDEFHRLLDCHGRHKRNRDEQHTLLIKYPDGTSRKYFWVNGLSYTDGKKRTQRANAIKCEETKGGKTTTFAWLTSLHVTAGNVDGLAIGGGRVRWKIENQGFNIQKNSDLNLEHAYSTDNQKIKSYYLLLQMAHIILQTVEMGSLLKRMASRFEKTPLQLFGSLKNIARRLLECIRNFVLPSEVFDLIVAAKIRITLDTS